MILVLTGSKKESSRCANDLLGLRVGEWKSVSDASAISGAKVGRDRVVRYGTWLQREDYPAIAEALSVQHSAGLDIQDRFDPQSQGV